MPVHALLGATGSTGAAVLQCLLDEPQPGLELRIFVRNKSKLTKTFPNLGETKSFKVTIIEGNLDDTAAMQRCLRDAELCYNCISSNEAHKGVSVAQDAAKAILAALRELKKSAGSAYKQPSVIINRSQTLNEEHDKTGGFMRNAVHFALFYCYDDIEKAVELLRAAHKYEQLCQVICADPPALHSGGKKTGHELKLTGDTFRSINYVDLGAAFVEIAQRKEEFAGKGVIIGATGDVEEHWEVLRGYIARGLRARVLGL